MDTHGCKMNITIKVNTPVTWTSLYDRQPSKVDTNVK